MTTAHPEQTPPSKLGAARAITRSRWFQPLLALLIGLATLAALSLGGHPARGAIALAALTVFSMLLLLGSRSDSIRGLRGDGRDERFELIRLKAAGAAARAVLLAVVAGMLVELAEGHSGTPYNWLSALAGVVFLLSVAYQQRRS